MKRAIDLVLAVPLALLLVLPGAVIALLVRRQDGGPVLHWSTRVGRNGRHFGMPKFRTMKVGTPQVATDKLNDPSSRLTSMGGVLRKLSLDEIPQLWSVIVGDMSLVGPRPALFNQDALIAERKARGIDVLRPGITGWAQVNGRDDISDARKIQLDEEYLSRRSLAFDLRVLWLTVWKVMRREGVAH